MSLRATIAAAKALVELAWGPSMDCTCGHGIWVHRRRHFAAIEHAPDDSVRRGQRQTSVWDASDARPCLLGKCDKYGCACKRYTPRWAQDLELRVAMDHWLMRRRAPYPDPRDRP